MPLPVAKPLEAPCMPRVATLENLDEILQDPRKRPFVIEVSVEEQLDEEKRRKKEKLLFMSSVVFKAKLGLVISGCLTVGAQPELILKMSGGNIAAASRMSADLMSIQAMLDLILNPMLATLSDSVGRKPVMVLAPFVNMVLRLWVWVSPSMAGMLALRLLGAGMTAASSIIGAAALQDLAGTDVKMLQDLNARDASVAGFATLMATPLGGYLARKSLTLPYLASAMTSAISLYMVATRLEETNLDPRPFDSKRFTQIKNIFSFTQLIGKDTDLTKLAGLFVLQDVTLRTGPIFPLVAKQRFGWGPDTMGNWVGIYGVCMMMPMMIQKKMLGWFGERGTCIAALFAHTLATICLSANQEALQWVSLVFFLVGLCKTSSCKSVLAKHSAEVTGLGRGQLQGAISSMVSLSMIISPLALSRMYTFFTSKRSPIHLPGAPFVYCTFATTVSMLLMSSVNNNVFAKAVDTMASPKGAPSLLEQVSKKT